MWPFKKKSEPVVDKNKIIGVVLGWDLKPHIGFGDGSYLPTRVERMLYPQYFKDGDWPIDPESGEKLQIAKV